MVCPNIFYCAEGRSLKEILAYALQGDFESGGIFGIVFPNRERFCRILSGYTIHPDIAYRMKNDGVPIITDHQEGITRLKTDQLLDGLEFLGLNYDVTPYFAELLEDNNLVLTTDSSNLSNYPFLLFQLKSTF